MRSFPRLFALAALFFTAVFTAHAAEKKFRVLIVDGQNNHDWKTATAWLQQFLTGSGLCTVATSTTPPKGAPAEAWAAWQPHFANYDVVVSNFNGGHQPDATRWPAVIEHEFEQYIRDGGGFVSLHAANNAFLHWPAYNDIEGLLWRDKNFGPGLVIDDQGKTVVVPTGQGRDAGHPPRLDFVMHTLPTGHPITAGFPAAWLHPSEQLTHGQRGPAAVVNSGVLQILTYARDETLGENEPMDWVRTYGRGRVYVTMLGHTWLNEPNLNLRCAGFQTLFLRGVEWTATGHVTVPVPADFPTASAISLRPN